MHTVKTTIVTSATGEISGYGFCVEAEHNGEPTEIAACITASLDMLRQTISASFAAPPAVRDFFADHPEIARANAASQFAADPPPPAPNPMGESEGDEVPNGYAPAQPPAVSVGQPATAAEAQQRFFARYGEIIGGSSWADVRAYLCRPRISAPTTVAQWISAAEAVRDHSRQPAPTARRQYARH